MTEDEKKLIREINAKITIETTDAEMKKLLLQLPPGCPKPGSPEWFAITGDEQIRKTAVVQMMERARAKIAPLVTSLGAALQNQLDDLTDAIGFYEAPNMNVLGVLAANLITEPTRSRLGQQVRFQKIAEVYDFVIQMHPSSAMIARIVELETMLREKHPENTLDDLLDQDETYHYTFDTLREFHDYWRVPEEDREVMVTAVKTLLETMPIKFRSWKSFDLAQKYLYVIMAIRAANP